MVGLLPGIVTMASGGATGPLTGMAALALAVAIFALNLLLANLAMQGTQEYARRHDLMRPGRYDFGAYRWNYAAGLAVIALSLAVAWINTTVAELCWLLFGVVPQIAVRLRRGWSRVRADV